MDKLNQKYDQLLKALQTLKVSIDSFKRVEGKQDVWNYNTDFDYEEEYKIHRDSVIQRFEYSIDLFWKYIKKYLESVHVLIGIKIPSEVVRQAYSLQLLDENQAEKILEMIKSRNMTSHIYVEEIAEQLSYLIPEYYKVLILVLKNLNPKK